MLKAFDLEREEIFEAINTSYKELQAELARLQQKIKEEQLPVLVIFEGWDASGKGTLINELIQELDPRGYKVEVFHESTEEEKRKPFLWRFWQKIPRKGEIMIFDRSWYRELVDDLPSKSNKYKLDVDDIINFEEILIDEGILLIKIFLHVSKKEQKSRLKALLSDDSTKWQVKEKDIYQNKNYSEYYEHYDNLLSKTNTSKSPWHLIDSSDKKNASKFLIHTAVELFKNTLIKEDMNLRGSENIDFDLDNQKVLPLSNVDLSLDISDEEYKKRLKKLQEKIKLLAYDLYREKIPTIIVFEGWDAAGKGGNIKRLTKSIDPRGYEVIPIAAPDETEKKYHYLWRFWKHLPKTGHMTIFDRSWYGRVMVERVEDFASENEWKRAYDEINQMESHLKSYKAIVLKFFIHIDKEEQLARFKAREENPDKRYKITDEDWRNREKWNLYESAINEMIYKTNTSYATWHIVPGNSKKYARVFVLEKTIEEMELALKKHK